MRDQRKLKGKPVKWVWIREMAKLRDVLREAIEVRRLQKTGIVWKGRSTEKNLTTSVPQSSIQGVVSFYQDGYWRLTTLGFDIGTKRKGTPIEIVYTEPIQMMLKLIPIYDRGRERETSITGMFRILHQTLNQRVKERVRRMEAEKRAQGVERIKANMRQRKIDMHKDTNTRHRKILNSVALNELSITGQ